MITINCDIGERGPQHVVDIELMNYVQIANIACGGHAGDAESVRTFRALAHEKGVQVSAHLSYPDKENFGRQSMEISHGDLLASLDSQFAMMPDVKMVKFHGALYNDSCKNQALAELLADWLVKHGITRIVTPANSDMADSCKARHIELVAEAFAERTYAYDPETGRLNLTNRSREYACIHNCALAVAQTKDILQKNQINAYIEHPDGSYERRIVPIIADTVCIHSDAVISLELARELSSLND